MDSSKETYQQRLQRVFQNYEGMTPDQRIQATISMRTPEDQRFFSKFMEQQCKFKEMKRTSPTTAVVTFTFKVDRFYCNGSGNLQGGFQATLFDICTSIALQSLGKQDFWINGGVSRALNVTFLRPAPEGEELLCDCVIVHMGKNLALTQGVLKRARDGAVISTCVHDKAAVPSKPGWKL